MNRVQLSVYTATVAAAGTNADSIVYLANSAGTNRCIGPLQPVQTTLNRTTFNSHSIHHVCKSVLRIKCTQKNTRTSARGNVATGCIATHSVAECTGQVHLPMAAEEQCTIQSHKALVGHAPQYIADLIRPVADLPSRASLRTAHSGDLYVPRTCRRFGDRAFAVTAPRVWNSLPTDIKVHRSTTTSFKRHLNTVLLNRGFAEYM